MSKKCTKCGVVKDESEFNKNRNAKDGLFTWCRECANAQSRKWYRDNWVKSLETTKLYQEANPDKITQYRIEHREQILQRNRDRYARGKELVESLKQPCAKCGDVRKYIIDFHHINPEDKLFEISKGTTGRAHKKLIAEAEKCVCLCRNCHTEFHHFYGNVPENPIGALQEYLGEELFDDQERVKGSYSINGARNDSCIEV